MSESGDYDPGDWKGHDFKSLRRDFDKHIDRGYSDAKAAGKTVKSMVPDSIETDSDAPVAIMVDVTGSMVDVTGSMGTFPATIFSKLPYVDIEGKTYLGDGMRTSFAAVGDCHTQIGDCRGDDYPFQIRPFVTGLDMEKELKKLVIEKGGGGQEPPMESYEVGLLYFARNVKTPKAIRKPILILVGDEGFYDEIPPEAAKIAKVETEKRILAKDVFEEVQAKWSVYLIRKAYDHPRFEGQIQKKWEDMLGKDRIVTLESAGRVVDVIFGILAKETGQAGYFKKELGDRQTPEQVEEVMKALKTIKLVDDGKGGVKPAKTMKALPGASMTRRTAGGKKSISLME